MTRISTRVGMLLLVASTVSVFGCALQTVQDKDLIGTYKASLPDGGTETLELLRDNICTQEIKLANGESFRAQGTWKFNAKIRQLYVKGTRSALTPTGQINPGLSEPPSNVSVHSSPVSRGVLGDVTIMLHEGIDYRKES